MVKVFEKEWVGEELETKINSWLEENKDLQIKHTKYRMSKGYHSCMIEYTKGVKL
jgi:hypothetical protein